MSGNLLLSFQCLYIKKDGFLQISVLILDPIVFLKLEKLEISLALTCDEKEWNIKRMKHF